MVRSSVHLSPHASWCAVHGRGRWRAALRRRARHWCGTGRDCPQDSTLAGRARYEIGGSARDQRWDRERVKGCPRGGRVSVPSRGALEPQAGLATDPRKPPLDVTRGGWLRAIRREEQRLVAVGASGIAGEPLCVQQRQERQRDAVAAREAAVVDGRHRGERQPCDLCRVRAGRARQRTPTAARCGSG